MWQCFQKNPPGGISSKFTSNKRKQWEAPPTGHSTCCLQSRRGSKRPTCLPHVAIKNKAIPMLASTCLSFRHNGILQFAYGKLRHKNVRSICWRQEGFAGNWSWRAKKLWRTCMSVTLVNAWGWLWLKRDIGWIYLGRRTLNSTWFSSPTDDSVPSLIRSWYAAHLFCAFDQCSLKKNVAV
jgi:hypothetical protein